MLFALILVSQLLFVNAASLREPVKSIFKPYSAESTFLSREQPEEWPDLFPTCGGRFQSPIVLEPRAMKSEDGSPLIFKNYDVKTNATLENTGNTVQLFLVGDVIPTLRGGGLVGEYVFAQLHFHWGSHPKRGSEHIKPCQGFAAEAHLVHYNSKYSNLGEALQYADGVAVLGVFIKERIRTNRLYASITNNLNHVRTANTTVGLRNPVALGDFLPSNLHKFFRYFGSLTVPTCDEAVSFLLLDTPVSLSSTQVNEFRQLKDKNNRPLVDNIRPVQPLNNRTIYAYGF